MMSHAQVVLHYFNLIAAVVEENSKVSNSITSSNSWWVSHLYINRYLQMVRISARTRVIGTDTRYYPSVGISSLDRDQTLIDNTLAERDQKLGHQKSTAALEHTAPAEYSESLSAVKIEDDCMDSDYMKAANVCIVMKPCKCCLCWMITFD